VLGGAGCSSGDCLGRRSMRRTTDEEASELHDKSRIYFIPAAAHDDAASELHHYSRSHAKLSSSSSDSAITKK
jgi:hypothetical protein